MKYADEELLRIKNQQETQEEAQQESDRKESLEVIYERRSFLDGRVSLEVPTDCKEVAEETVNFIFYGTNKPQYVIESESTEIALGYNYTEMEISDDDIFRFANFASKALETMGPGVKILKVKNHKRDHFNLSLVEFTSKGFDGGIYNQMFYTSVEGKLLISFVILPSKRIEERKEIVEHIIESFELTSSEAKNMDQE